MPVWSGFGVNYKAAQSQWSADMAYFQSIGLQYIRPHMPGTPQPWNSTTNALWRNCCQTFHNAGFWVTWGTSQSPITAGNWQSLHDSIVAEATYLQQQGIVVDEFEVGNEYEGGAIYSNFKSLTQTGGTATAVTNRAHGFSNGESVTIYDTNPAGYEGTYTITYVNSTTFTFSCNSSLASPATAVSGNGSIFGYCYSLTIPQLNALIRQLATDVKAVYNLGRVSYACYNSSINGGTPAYTDWINNGLGGLDALSIHPYGSINLATQTISNGGFPYIAEMVSAFGNQVYISEFNLDAGSTNLSGISDAQAVIWMQTFWNMITTSGIERALIYEWNEYLSNSVSDYGFAQLRPNGTLNPQWFDFFTSQPKAYTHRLANGSRAPTVPRSATVARGANTTRNLI